jgi:hypothetical protein
MRLLEI